MASLELEMKKILAQINDGFSKQDAESVMQLFADCPNIIFIGSEVDEIAMGRDQLRFLLKRLFLRDEKYQFDFGHVQISERDNVAWIAAPKSVIHVECADGQSQSLPYRLTIILERFSQTWLCVHFHGSEAV